MLSSYIYRPWCRILCPFGALVSLTSRFSRYKLRRTESCTNCGSCENISEVIKYIQDVVAEEITEHFRHVMQSKDYNVNDVPSARKHINAYLHLTLYSHHLYHFIRNPVLHEKDEH